METRYRGTFQQNFDFICPSRSTCSRFSIVRMYQHTLIAGVAFDTFQLKGTGVQQEVKDWIKLAEWVRYEPSCIFESDCVAVRGAQSRCC